ncbi:MAG: MBL fold metallo-hydrolase [Promethearchaeota archaeon]|nr:MAG: MBL fold metallo-hydrolase [Candidatus Lokiarchaeota archaeon]
MLIYEKIVDGIFLVYSDSQFWFKCNGIFIKNKNSGNILIDCNCFYKKEIMEIVKNQINSYFVSHVHLDHVYNLHFYEEFDPKIKIYCPIPENEYLKDFNNFIKANGTLDFGIGDEFKKFAFKELNFKELNSVIGFNPGTEFEFKNIRLKTLHIPGHSPGHTAFSIEGISKQKRKILFVSDIGLTKMGAWYGFKYSNLKDVRDSIKKIEKIYLNDEYIITSGHGPIIFEKQPKLFNDLLKKMDNINEKLLLMLDIDEPKKLDDLIFKGLFFSEDYINSRKGDSILFFFENNMITSHIRELIEKKKVIEVTANQWILKN